MTEEKLIKIEKLLKEVGEVAVSTHRENANVGNNFSAKLLQIASSTNKLVVLESLPIEFQIAYLTGAIHIHDLDAYNLTVNCLNVDTFKSLMGGFNTGYGTNNQPKRVDTAASLSCIVLQSTQNDMFGGQAHYDFDNAFAYFVEQTDKEIRRDLYESINGIEAEKDATIVFNNERTELLVAKRLQKAVAQAMQIVIHNLNSMHSRAGAQVPFSSINIGIPKNDYAALVCEEFLKQYDKGLGKGEQPIFPNIAFRTKSGINLNPEDPYYYLFKLACRVAAKRMNPTFLNIDSPVSLPYYEQGIMPAVMGCRTRLMENVNGPVTPCSRGNIAPVSMNLVKMAIETIHVDKLEVGTPEAITAFFKKLDDTIDLCERQLLHRYDVLKKLKGKDLPFIVSQNLIMGAEQVGEEDSIEPILKQGSWGIGYIGMAETLTCLVGKHHGESKESWELAYSIAEHIYNRCADLRDKHNLNFAAYHSPAEGLAGRFTKIDKETYGIIPGVTDRDYYTNSTHIPVHHPITIIEKMELEAPFHKLATAGHISYIELDGTPVDNPEVVENIIRHTFTTTEASYIGVNFGIRYCRECGENHVHGSICPQCQSSNIQGVYRVTGYLSLEERFGGGKAVELKSRISHN